MANYQYDESGILASYFILTFLSFILVPLSISYIPTPRAHTKLDRCECAECDEREARIKKSSQQSILKPRLGLKGLFTVGGWALFAFLAYKVATTELETKIYDPFEILGIRSGSTEKEIKRHYKKLSLKFHPDKVKLAVNQTLEEVESYFVSLTKAYKALTDEETRNNLEKYGHPDGKQEFSMGLALPTWVVESKNNLWILGLYGFVIAGLLPMFVGRWWFGSRKYTKDGVLSSTAQLFFKNVREETTQQQLPLLLARAWDLEEESHKVSAADGQALGKLEASIKAAFGEQYGKTPETDASGHSIGVRRALALLYAQLLRVKVQSPQLEHELEVLLPATQTYLSSMLSMSLAHNWLACSVNIMHLHSHLVQGTFPGSDLLLAFPSVTAEETKAVEGGVAGYLKALEEKQDPRAEMVKRVADKWGSLDVVDSQFKVIGERIVTPGAIVQLVFKLRLTPPSSVLSTEPRAPTPEPTPEERKKEILEEDEKELAFLQSKEDSDALLPGLTIPGHAHAPRWPQPRKPSWWVMIGDQKLNKVIVPPIRISDVPYGNPAKAPKDFRTYKLQFQAPPSVGIYTFQILFVSDTFVGGDVRMFLPLKVEDLSALTEDEQGEEDEISDPDEDTLAGQMAAMRGEKVKRSAIYGSDDDESSTDDDESSGGDDSSDSDDE